jgi:uncharacterized protein YccT (UPF0319 family)
MPLRTLAGNSLSNIRSLASRGDDMAVVLMNLLDNTYFCVLTAGAEVSNVIRITGQIKDQDGQNVAGVKDVLVKSKPVSGAGTLAAVASNGTVKAGAASVEAWVQTIANGSFQLDVTNAAAEDNLIVVTLDNGTVETLKLTYA